MAVAAVDAGAPPPDREVQPCKKRKEDDLPAEAITKYFSPLAKHVLSPPKSNNIMDYFKKSSPASEKITSPTTVKESKTSRSCLENSSKPLSSLKKKGKRCNLNDKLKVMGTIEHDLVIEINSDDSKERFSPKKEDSKTCHSLPALLPPQKAEVILIDCDKKPVTNISCKTEENMKLEGNVIKRRLRRSKKRKRKDETDLTERFTPETQLKEQCKEDKQVLSTTEAENNKSVINKSILEPETVTHKTPQLNDCVVTVSFEDFLKSQGENNEDIPKSHTPDESLVSDETVSFQAAQQLPLKTVTVLAQIHSVPPKSSRKIASIFLKQKPKEAKRQSISSSEVEYGEQMTQKRKSNVVISEEELELSVLETAGSNIVKSKCTAEERLQFMKAFRQPESDTTKTGNKKGFGKQKEVGEKSSKYREEIDTCKDDSNKVDNEVLKDNVGNYSHSNDSKKDTTGVRHNKLNRKKLTREAKGKGVKSNDSSNNDASNQIKGAISCGSRGTLPQKKRLRRSSRQRASQTSINTTPEKTKDSETAAKNTLDVIPLQTSTPKGNRNSFNKSDLYKAEVITEPFDSKSPIRMKFTRISTHEGHTKQNIKVYSTFSNISKAKKLVEKAKALQQNRATRILEDTQCTPLRRSSRQQALAERKMLQNAEDSVIILDSCPSNINIPENVKKQKNLKCLNDVLGKKAGNVKTAKKSSGKERASSLTRKKVQKSADEAITIFVDSSSEDESENSQDDERFKSKREFLMSGLPESLKRQIAKKAATLEAYSAANSCFQTVVHVQQKDDGCSIWKLMPPTCPLLTNIRELNSEIIDFSRLTLSLGEFSYLNTQPNSNNSAIMPSGWRPVFSETVRRCLLEEIRSSNFQFPVNHFFDQLLKKQVVPEHNKPGLQLNKCKVASLETDSVSDNKKETKSKRRIEDRKFKRKKQLEETDIELSDISKEPCVKQARLGNMHLVDTYKTEKPELIIVEDSEFGSSINSVPGFENEEILWTEKYQPQNSSEVVGNTEAVKKLHRWLSEWKRRTDLEENKSQKEGKESLDSTDFKDDLSDDEEENLLCNTMLLIGPPGIGKTASVYACAQELGFKIFEVNASCQRSGRQILSQLKEATQSHQVDKQGVNAHKPFFFTSCSSTKSPRKNSPRKERSPRKLPVSPRKVGLKQGMVPKTLANYFKISSKPKKKEEKAQENNEDNKQHLSEEKIQSKLVKRGSNKEEFSKKSATSLILFEEVDIILDEDVGFLNAIKTFMTTTKRPVILTTNDPSFSFIFDGYFEEITFSAPSLINVASYLQVLCLAENLRTDVRDFAALLTANNSDIRQSLLHLQFWIRSGGGALKEKGLVLHKDCKEKRVTEQIACTEETRDPRSSKPYSQILAVPKCDTGCFEHLHGLKNIFLPSEDLFSFLKHEITTEDWSKLIHLLTGFQMKNIDFIYSNLEFILPLPLAIVPEPTQMANSTLNEIADNSSNDRASDYMEKTSPVKKVKKKRQRNMALLDDSDLFESELNYSGFITIPADTSSLCLEDEEESELHPVTDDTTALSTGKNPKGSALSFQCLNSLSEFVENMSFLDCCFNNKTRESNQTCKPEEFLWTKARIKNGVSDESSEECSNWWSSQSSSELKAVVEALSFNKCFKNISRTMDSYLKSHSSLGKDELEELTLHVSKEQANIYFSQSTVSARIHRNAQKRLEIIEAVFSSRTLSNLGNTQASIVEYMPTLRNICRSEKQKEKGKTKRRFLHYLEGIHLDFSRELLTSLAADFP